MVRRDLYTKYKNCTNRGEREKARPGVSGKGGMPSALDGKFFLQCVGRERVTLLLWQLIRKPD